MSPEKTSGKELTSLAVLTNVLHVRSGTTREPEMITFLAAAATDFQSLYSVAQATVAGVWTFFAGIPTVVVSVF